MAKLDLRVRLLGWVVGLASVDRMDEQRLARLQRQKLKHSPMIDLLLGRVARSVTLTDRTATGETGPLRIRVYRPVRSPGGPLPLVVNFHGGGWALGSLEQADWLCSNVSATVGAVVVSVDYRLAPTHPFPAAVEDCYAALVDVAARAEEFGADGSRLAVLGDSAGGNLAAVMALLGRDRGGPRIAHQGLLYPATDLTLGSPSLEENAHAPILTRAECIAFRELYLGDADPKQPNVSPLHAPDHANLPPALIQVAEHDPIRDDGLRYAEVLRAAGVPVRATTYVGMPHGFLSFPYLCRAAPQALAELCTEISAALRPA